MLARIAQPNQAQTELLSLIPAGIEIPECIPTVHSRAPFTPHPNPEAPARFALQDKTLRWNEPLPEYRAPHWTCRNLERQYATPTGDERPDHPDPSTLDPRTLISHFGKIQIDERGAPLNPAGRTGLADRASLWCWGPNHVVDVPVTRFPRFGTGIEVALVLKRYEWGTRQLALIGGHRRVTEDARDSTCREAMEEAGIELSPDDLTLLSSGYMDSALNTDNAWLEVNLFGAHVSFDRSTKWDMRPQDTHEIEEALWVPVVPSLFASLPFTHQAMLAQAIYHVANTRL